MKDVYIQYHNLILSNSELLNLIYSDNMQSHNNIKQYIDSIAMNDDISMLKLFQSIRTWISILNSNFEECLKKDSWFIIENYETWMKLILCGFRIMYTLKKSRIHHDIMLSFEQVPHSFVELFIKLRNITSDTVARRRKEHYEECFSQHFIKQIVDI